MRTFLFEFEDLAWFPDSIRRSMVDFLSFFLRVTDYYKPITPLIAECLEHSIDKQVIDLCSGGGGPIPRVQKNLEAFMQTTVPIILTDKFPNISAYEHIRELTGGSINFKAEPVDATNVPADLRGMRTSFSAFHHFDENGARKILQDAVASRVPIAIFDGGDKNLLTIFGLLLVHPIIFFFCTPFFKPFRMSRLVFTYLLPVIPFCTIWDGAVSITRLYRPRQLDRLASEADDGSYIWKSGIKRHPLGFGISYLTGYPRA